MLSLLLAQSAEHIHGKEKLGLFSSSGDQQEQPFAQVNAGHVQQPLRRGRRMGQMENRLDAAYPVRFGIAVGADAVWVLSSNRLVRIDPARVPS